MAKKTAKKSQAPKKAAKKKSKPAPSSAPTYPRHSSEAALRIPKAILDQNAGKPSSDAQAAEFLNLKSAKGPFAVEISSGIKYGFLNRPSTGTLEVTELAKQILRPKSSNDIANGYQQAVLNAPTISDVYMHYRGENLPDRQFFDNALEDTFKIPRDKLSEFKDVFTQCLTVAKLSEQHDGRVRILHSAASDEEVSLDGDERIEKIGKGAGVKSTDTCFVMMPFGAPIGKYYDSVYKPAIEKAGLTPMRADDEIFGAGKIMDQIWLGINNAKILVAELTGKNPNVFYELGLAHALQKPVVLVSSNEDDVPFDLRHIRVIYYDCSDPFWGQKLMAKVAENILSALKNPEEAMFEPLSQDVT
ncbi:TIR domain-containing protein [Allorhodopirellula solitaria]|uniref:Nucleoside 2-deoxyribosyltransferase n=1 Tax=Allorhodopirellula solitaria TaxID=2527987 RepID=A0A5C5XZV4_9BACT|nr:hypothetical protein [Allorhodopirellula solitaria]TWT67485.1 hypothetical protein CA85_23360 [Allorhodopirellula solitaria]